MGTNSLDSRRAAASFRVMHAADREDSIEAARRWAERLASERVSLLDCTRSEVLLQVGRLIGRIQSLEHTNDALAKIIDGKRGKWYEEIRCQKDTIRALRCQVMSLQKSRTAASVTSGGTSSSISGTVESVVSSPTMSGAVPPSQVSLTSPGFSRVDSGSRWKLRDMVRILRKTKPGG